MTDLAHSHVEIRSETGSGRDHVTHDHILFEADQFILFAAQRRLCQHLGGFLEARCRDEALRLHRSLRNPLQKWIGGRRLLTLGHDLFVDGAESEFVDHRIGEKFGIPWIHDLHVSQHLRHDDLDVLVVDRHVLRTVDLLDLCEEISLDRFDPFDAQDVLRYQVSVDQRITGDHMVTLVNTEVLSVRDRMLDDHTVFVADVDDLLTALLLTHLDQAIDLCDDRWILRTAYFEDFGNSRQSPSDVLSTGNLPRGLRQHRACGDLVTWRNFDVCLLW